MTLIVTAMEKATHIFRELVKTPSVIYSHLCKTEDDLISISTVWSQRDLERGESVKFSTTHVAVADTQKFSKLGSSTELKNE